MTAVNATQNNSTAVILAEMVQREKLARRVYLTKLKAPKEEKAAAFKSLKQEEENVDTMLNAILNPLPAAPVYTNKRF